MVRLKVKRWVVLFFIFLGTNLSFVILHYAAEQLASQQLAEQRYAQAFADGHWSIDQYPFKSSGHGSIKNLDGLDQYSECVNALMTIYRNIDHPLQNAIIPGYQSYEDEEYCDALKKILIDREQLDLAKTITKPRLWFGAKAFTLLLLPGFEIAQLYAFLKQLSYLGFALLLAFGFSHSRRMGWATMPITVIGTFGSGIPYYGGIANALPFAVAIYLGLGMAGVRRFCRDWLNEGYVVVAGSVMAFFYLTDGSLILVISLLLYSIYFLESNKPLQRQRLQELMWLVTLFVASFFLSFLVKQILATMVLDFPTVWKQFTDMLSLRMSTRGGPDWNRWQAFYGQFQAYNLAVLWNRTLYLIILYAGFLGWVVAVLLTLVNTLISRSHDHICAQSVFMAIAMVVFLRYFLMANHSFEHWFIVTRYVFVFLSVGVSAAIYHCFSLGAIVAQSRCNREEGV